MSQPIAMNRPRTDDYRPVNRGPTLNEERIGTVVVGAILCLLLALGAGGVLGHVSPDAAALLGMFSVTTGIATLLVGGVAISELRENARLARANAQDL